MKFGTSGLRGLVTDMTDDVCAAYVTAFLAHLAATGRAAAAVLVGRDLRPSSPRIAAACRAAIRTAGADAVDCGAVPTPALALEAAARGAPAVMVTGSHIPFDRNGLKFYAADGEITKADEAGIVAALAAPPPPAARAGAAIERSDCAARYRERAIAFFGPAALAGRRLGVWQHSAVGRDLLVELLAGMGADVVPLGRSDVFTPVDTEALDPEAERRIRAWTAEHGLDAVVSTDGDGDRPLVCDETGTFVRGDLLGLLTARALAADMVATPVSSSTALERSGWMRRVVRTRIGSPHVIAALTTAAADGAALPVGYEANGGFLLGGPVAGPDGATLAPLLTRDAVLPMAATLAAAAAAGAPLSALAAGAPARATASDRLQDVDPDRSARLVAALAAEPSVRTRLLAVLGGPAVVSVDTLDGVRMTLAGDEIAHLRPSGNAPELRCYAEAADPARASAMVSALLRRSAEWLGA